MQATDPSHRVAIEDEGCFPNLQSLVVLSSIGIRWVSGDFAIKVY